MARSHHRKKHKEHLRQFKHSQEGSTVSSASPKTRAAVIFAILGGLLGLAVGYFATNGNLVWLGAGAGICGIAGFFFGRNVDRSK